MRWLGLLVVGVAVLAGCGDRDDQDARKVEQAGQQPNAQATEPPSVDSEPRLLKIVARGAHITAGERGVRLLALPRVGRLLVGCDRSGLSSTTFVAGRRTATADVVVEAGNDVFDASVDPGERFAPRTVGVATGIEHWRIAQFAKAQTPIATITVAARTIEDEGDPVRCAISAQAIVFASTQGTLTH